MADIAAQLKRFRLNAKMTQQELAVLLNVSQNEIFNWENGKREPNFEMVEKIATVLNVSPVQIMGWDEEYQKLGIELDMLEEAFDKEKIEKADFQKTFQRYIKLYRDEFELEKKIENIARKEKTPEQLSLHNDTKMLNFFHSLNVPGQNKAIEQVELLTKIPEYRKEQEPDGSDTPK